MHCTGELRRSKKDAALKTVPSAWGVFARPNITGEDRLFPEPGVRKKK